MRSIVFTFGRFNPPTRGHQRLIDKVLEVSKTYNAKNIVYLSQSQDNSKNPLSWEFKKRVCISAFPNINISNDNTIKTPFNALEQFRGIYEKVVFVVGGDRLEEFKCKMLPYAKLWGIDLEIISAGNRNNNINGIEGISSSKLRQYALDNKEKEFINSLPNTLNKQIKSLIYRNTKNGLKKIKK